MSIILFIAILVVLIIVHELGHFIAAKRAGIRVDEFGLGYPPRAWGVKKGETTYSLNWLPFGGFVKIFGEDPDDESLAGPDKRRSMSHKPRYVQALVLAAGIIFNVLFAWVLVSAGYMTGLPSSVESGDNVRDAKLMVIGTVPGSPAEAAGLKPGDLVVGLRAGDAAAADLSPKGVQDFIRANEDETITILRERDGVRDEVSAAPVEGLVPEQKAVGFSMDLVGMLKLPPHEALLEGAKTTWGMTQAIVVGIAMLIGGAFSGAADLSQVTGPVGIAGMVGDAQELGFAYILTFTAFISLNLAVINLVPFPALDGGRILFVLIEAIRRRPLSPRVANTANAIGFVLLLALMAVVTVNDIVRLF